MNFFSRLRLQYALAAALLFGIFFPALPVGAEAQCCIVTTRTTVELYGVEGSERVSQQCSIVAAGQGCPPSIPRQCTRSFTGGPNGDEVDTNTCTTIVSEQGPCARYVFQCRDTITNLTDCSLANGDQPTCLNTRDCFYAGDKCFNRFDNTICHQLPREVCGTDIGAKSTACQWNENTQRCLQALDNELSGRYTDHGRFLPTCAYLGNCRSVNDLLIAGIRVAKYIFSIIGSFAFAFFVYGGATMVLSFGNADKVSKGKGILLAAVIGLAISFGAYLLIDFILDVLGAAPLLRGVST